MSQNNPAIKTSTLIIAAIVSAVILWIFQQTASALAPFILAAVAAYIMAPIARKLESRLGKTTSSALLVLLLLILMLALPLALLPIIAEQIATLAAALPSALSSLAKKIGSWLGESQPQILEQLRNITHADIAKQMASLLPNSGSSVSGVFGFFGAFFGKGISAAVGFVMFLLITPLAAFYFIRDRHHIVNALIEYQPPRWRPTLSEIAKDLDHILGEFLHGQLLVIAVMGALYSTALWLAGLNFALTIGLISGLLVFIPYVGFMIGMLLATLVGLGQFDSLTDFAIVWVAMLVGTTIETLFITPWLVGNRTGLHPLAVLLSLFVMGSLLGFVGVLAALPLAAIIMVLTRHARRRYIKSEFYERP